MARVQQKVYIPRKKKEKQNVQLKVYNQETWAFFYFLTEKGLVKNKVRFHQLAGIEDEEKVVIVVDPRSKGKISVNTAKPIPPK